MKVKDFINAISKFDPDLEVTITDGMRQIGYMTNNIEMISMSDSSFLNGQTFVDIGIGWDKI